MGEKHFSIFFKIFFKSISGVSSPSLYTHQSFFSTKHSLSKTSKVEIYMKCFSLKALILHFVQCANILFFILQMYGLVDFSLGCATKHYRYGLNKYIQNYNIYRGPLCFRSFVISNHLFCYFLKLL